MGLSWRHPELNGGLASALDTTPANTGDCKDGNRVSLKLVEFDWL